MCVCCDASAFLARWTCKEFDVVKCTAEAKEIDFNNIQIFAQCQSTKQWSTFCWFPNYSKWPFQPVQRPNQSDDEDGESERKVKRDGGGAIRIVSLFVLRVISILLGMSVEQFECLTLFACNIQINTHHRRGSREWNERTTENERPRTRTRTRTRERDYNNVINSTVSSHFQLSK